MIGNGDRFEDLISRAGLVQAVVRGSRLRSVELPWRLQGFPAADKIYIYGELRRRGFIREEKGIFI
jgi:hypothetical protein